MNSREIDAAIAQAVAELKEENTRLLNDADYAADARVAQAVEREQTRIGTWLRQQGGSGPFFADALAECRREALDAARQTATCIPGSCSTHEGMPFFVDTRDSSAFCIFCDYAQQADEIARLNLRLAALMGDR